MATVKRLIDANALQFKPDENCAANGVLIWGGKHGGKTMTTVLYALKKMIDNAPTVDAVEVYRLGRLGQLLMPYTGDPRGPMGARGESGNSRDQTWKITELDAITDVDGNRWIPVLDTDLEKLKGAEVVDGRWEPHPYAYGFVRCSVCHDCIIYDDWAGGKKWNYCPNCGAKMDGGTNNA